MKKLFLLFSVCLLLHTANTEAKEIKAVITEFPMLASEEKIPGLGNGLFIDIFNEIMQESGIKINYLWVPFARAQNMFMSDKVPFTFGGTDMFARLYNKNIEEFGHIPIVMIRTFYFYYTPNQKRKHIFKKFEELKGMTVMAPRGWPTAKEIEELGVKLAFYDDSITGFKMLIAGRTDFINESEIKAFNIINRFYENEVNNFKIIKKPWYIASSGLVYKSANKESAYIAKKLNNGLYKIKADGRYKIIIQRYWGSKNVPEELFIK
ncbi:MAG: transporter substrate-binding domain-containing protein [Spirochaetes bacterium]|nr:transporter substrate-binding domain-containing protein [Spirochaetota bacterium]